MSVDGRGSAGLAADGEQVMCLTYLANDLCVLMLRSRVGARLHDGVPTSEVLPSARSTVAIADTALAFVGLVCAAMHGGMLLHIPPAGECCVVRVWALLVRVFTAHVIF